MFKHLIALFLFLAAFNVAAQTATQKKMVKFIDSMASVYESMYAPALWKKEFANWTVQAEALKAKDRVLAGELSLSEYHKVVNDFVLSMKDYHVSVNFFATEESSLPFMVRGTEGRYFFVYIDREKLPKSSFPFELGDELLEMEGVKVGAIVSELKANMGGNTEETDEALAQMTLTKRSASKARYVPQGPVTLKIQKGDKVLSHQLIWDYKKERVSQRLSNNTKANSRFAGKSLRSSLENLEMSSGLALDMARDAKADNLFALGSKKSFIPALGNKIWESDKESSYDAYIYLSEAKELVGYIRIPSYGAGEKEAKEFKEIMKKFNEVADKLVIDQVNNPGGSVFYLYSLVSMLTDRPMATPKHYMSINQKMVLEALNSLEELEGIKDLEGLKKAMGGAETISGYPLSMTFLEFMKAHYQFQIDEWNKGKTLTSPYHLYGVDKINPHPEVRFTKPILLLVNELDFSGGDFFPAIMQDNKRATIMGVRTAGAGGYVIGLEIPNQFGVSGFRYTGSLADRVDHTPIENLGVTPDIDYALSVEDYQGEFKSFADKIKETVNEL